MIQTKFIIDLKNIKMQSQIVMVLILCLSIFQLTAQKAVLNIGPNIAFIISDDHWDGPGNCIVTNTNQLK